MELGKRKKAELVERVNSKWDELNPQQPRCSEIWKDDIAAVVTLVLSECESLVAPLVEALEYISDCGVMHVCKPGCGCYSGKARDALAAYRASLADEPEPTLLEAAAALVARWDDNGSGHHGSNAPECEALRAALAREREKRS